MGNILKKSSKSSSKLSSKSSSKSSSKLSSKSLSLKNIDLLTNNMKIKNVINYDINENGLLFNKYKILKTISHGLHGIVYLVEDSNKNKYAYKVEKISEKELINNYDSSVLRQLDFFENVAKKYVNSFMNLYDYYITNDCNFNYNYILQNTIHKNKVLAYKDLPYCIHYFYNLIDSTLFDLLKSWKYFQNKIFNALLLQLLYNIYILNLHGYTHNDLHIENVGLIKTKNKYINILNKKIPTYGYYIQLIDFGKIDHNKYHNSNLNSNLNSLLIQKYKSDLIGFIYIVVISKYFNFSKKIEKTKNINMLKIVLKTHLEIPKNNLIIINNKLNELLQLDVNKNYYYKYKRYLQKMLYQILYYKEFQKSLDSNYIVQLNDFMSNDDIFFIIKNLYNPYKVLKYFLEKF